MECPTDILIDLGEDILSYTSAKSSSVLDIFQSEVCVKEKKNILLQTNKDYPSILDISPCKAIGECDFSQIKTISTVIEQNIISEEVNDCPTAILVDIPRSFSTFKPDIEFISYENISRQYSKQNNAEQELKDKFDALSPKEGFKKYFDTSPTDETNNQLPQTQEHWKTPSPQSMSQILKEASKVIKNLNSSAIFDEDSLLIEEKLALHNDFEDIDLKAEAGVKKDTKSEMPKMSVRINSQSSVTSFENDDKRAVDSRNYLMLNQRTMSESKIINLSEKTPNSNSLPSAMSSDLHDNGFIENPTSEYKENVQRRKPNNKIAKLNAKTPSKILMKSESNFQFCTTLKNVSNIKSESTNSEKSFVKKSIMPQRRISLASKINEVPFPISKLQFQENIKEVESQNVSKASIRSKQFLLPSNMQKPDFLKKKSSSPDIKQSTRFLSMKTPSKSYSISTPLKSTSIVKPPQTTVLSKNTPARYTPQFAQASRLFSKSLQQPVSLPRFSMSREINQQNFTPLTGTSHSKTSSRIQNAFNKQKIQSFSQSMSAASFQKGKNVTISSSKSRKSNLASTLSAEHDKKLARNLFSSFTGK